MSKQLPKEASEQYDLIGFDPRGVGASTPVTCGLENGQGWSPIQFDVAKFDEHVAQTKAIADRCWAAQTDLLPYVTTRNTARDMNVIRMALGERKISYYGISYGTCLGAVYTQMFPGQSDRVVYVKRPGPRVFDRSRLWLVAPDGTTVTLGEFA